MVIPPCLHILCSVEEELFSAKTWFMIILEILAFPSPKGCMLANLKWSTPASLTASILSSVNLCILLWTALQILVQISNAEKLIHCLSHVLHSFFTLLQFLVLFFQTFPYAMQERSSLLAADVSVIFRNTRWYFWASIMTSGFWLGVSAKSTSSKFPFFSEPSIFCESWEPQRKLLQMLGDYFLWLPLICFLSSLHFSILGALLPREASLMFSGISLPGYFSCWCFPALCIKK